MDVKIIQDSKNFNTYHNLSFSCQEVRIPLIILLTGFFFFFLGCVEIIDIDFKKIVKHNFDL